MMLSTSIGVDDIITTITQSVDGSTTTTIHKNYLMTIKILIRLNDRDNNPKQEKIKEACNKMINAVLKKKMIIKAQKLGVTYIKGEKEGCVSNFLKLGHA